MAKKWKVIPLLGEPYVLDIIASLYEKPKRYVDLSDVCPNEVTRTDRLRKLEEANFVMTTTEKIGKRPFIHYGLTKRGKTIFEQIEKIEAI